MTEKLLNWTLNSWFSRCLNVYTIYGRGGHLGHVTSLMSINFHFLVSESLHIKFGSNGPVVYEKSQFKFSSSTLFVMDSTFFLPDRLHTF